MEPRVFGNNLTTDLCPPLLLTTSLLLHATEMPGYRTQGIRLFDFFFHQPASVGNRIAALQPMPVIPQLLWVQVGAGGCVVVVVHGRGRIRVMLLLC